MVAYSFQPMFVDPILMGRKVHTIRADRKRHARVGEQLQLYTGMRTKKCRLIARAQCLDVLPLSISFTALRATDRLQMLDGQRIEGDGLDAFAYRDGFDSWRHLKEFWCLQHGRTDRFDGVIIYWRDMECML
ncbi:MAG TPA: ASCH domain-containing protein [Reyranella sp.]|nr:ASCH domain-containing protein [Reyranella sp.]